MPTLRCWPCQTLQPQAAPTWPSEPALPRGPSPGPEGSSPSQSRELAGWQRDIYFWGLSGS